MKPTTRCALLGALCCCLLSPRPGSAQGLRPLSAAALPPPRLTADGVLFTRPAYDALRADYAWLNQALALKNQRLAAAAAVDTSTTRLLARAQADLAASRTNEHNSFRAEQDLMAKYARSVARERPFFLLDKRLYLGGGIGLGLGVLGTAYLLARWH